MHVPLKIAQAGPKHFRNQLPSISFSAPLFISVEGDSEFSFAADTVL
jgi:hypothetical protein